MRSQFTSDRAGLHGWDFQPLAPAAIRRYNFLMTVKTFRDLLTRRPFQPFRLVMSSGESYEVRHPEMAWLTSSDIVVGVDETDDGVPADFRICLLLHVTAIEPLDRGVADRPSETP